MLSKVKDTVGIVFWKSGSELGRFRIGFLGVERAEEGHWLCHRPDSGLPATEQPAGVGDHSATA